MSYFGDFVLVLCVWGWAFCIASILLMHRWVQDHAVGQLIGLTLIAALGWFLCLVGYGVAADVAKPLELLGMHPRLGPVVWLGGPIGIGAVVVRLCRVRRWSCSDVTWSQACALVVVATALGCAWLWSLGPPLRADEGIYHLSLPLQYIRSGGYTVVAGHGNSGFFALGDMLFWWCMIAGAPGAARQMQLLVALVGLGALVSQTASPVRGRVIWAWAMWLCVPVVFLNLGCAYVDVVEAVFTLVGLSCLARWYRLTKLDDHRDLAQAAWLLGAAAACRQLALSSLPALGLVVLLRVRAEDRAYGEVNKKWQIAGACGLCCVLPLCFVLHNIWVFGNPVFPFAADFFAQGAQLRPSQMQVLEQFLAQHGPMHANTPRTGLDALWHMPWALLFDAAFNSPKFDGVIGALPLVAAGVAFYSRCDKISAALKDAQFSAERLLLFGFAGLRGAVWLSTSWQARFLIMPLGALSLWTCYAWPRQANASKTSMQVSHSLRITWAGATLVALGSLRGHAPIWDTRYLGSAAARYQARLQQLPASRLCEIAANQQGQSARVMLVWTQRLAIFCPTALWSDSYDEAASLVAWLEDVDGPSVVARLHKAHITHLLVDEQALLQVPQEADAAERSRWKEVFARWHAVAQHDLRLEGVQGAVRLYAVLSP